MELYFIHYSCVVIILVNTGLYTANAQISVPSRISARPPFIWILFISAPLDEPPPGRLFEYKTRAKGGGGLFEYLKTSI